MKTVKFSMTQLQEWCYKWDCSAWKRKGTRGSYQCP